ncbi:MAG: hypothetical protein NTV19_15305, partial [Burkholderiales bacterium]|nr:hypothetical protein [Burkholderiales bacterium]
MRAIATVALAAALAGCGAFPVGPDYAGAPATRSLSQAAARTDGIQAHSAPAPAPAAAAAAAD